MLAAAYLVLTQVGEGSSPSSPTSKQSKTTSIECGGARAGTGGRLLTDLTQVRFLSPQLNISEVIRPDEEPVSKTGAVHAVVGSSPTASATSCVLLSERLGARFPIWPGGFDSRRALWGSANGRLPAFEAGGEGSIPSP